MRLEVRHDLWLDYDDLIRESYIELHLQPKTTSGQRVGLFALAVGPPTRVHRYRDWNDNQVHHLSIIKFHDRIEVHSRSLVDTRPLDVALDALVDCPPYREQAPALRDWLGLGGPLPETPRLKKFAAAVTVPRRAPVGEQVRRIGEHLRREFTYEKNVTRYDSSTDDFLRLGRGVCQDFAHLMLALLRLRQIPCRYVSGYLHVERDDTEVSQSHAWVEFYTPAHGWTPFDATHDRVPDDRYVVVAHGRHYDDVPPNTGIYRGNAKEALRAQVHTTLSTEIVPAELREDVRLIDLPLIHEAPERRRERPIRPEDEAAAQQQ
jgi:transglutaminase-like putative cysteine protease